MLIRNDKLNPLGVLFLYYYFRKYQIFGVAPSNDIFSSPNFSENQLPKVTVCPQQSAMVRLSVVFLVVCWSAVTSGKCTIMCIVSIMMTSNHIISIILTRFFFFCLSSRFQLGVATAIFYLKVSILESFFLSKSKYYLSNNPRSSIVHRGNYHYICFNSKNQT